VSDIGRTRVHASRLKLHLAQPIIIKGRTKLFNSSERGKRNLSETEQNGMPIVHAPSMVRATLFIYLFIAASRERERERERECVR
jgi:hypothetical protein